MQVINELINDDFVKSYLNHIAMIPKVFAYENKKVLIDQLFDEDFIYKYVVEKIFINLSDLSKLTSVCFEDEFKDREKYKKQSLKFLLERVAPFEHAIFDKNYGLLRSVYRLSRFYKNRALITPIIPLIQRIYLLSKSTNFKKSPQEVLSFCDSVMEIWNNTTKPWIIDISADFGFGTDVFGENNLSFSNFSSESSANSSPKDSQIASLFFKELKRTMSETFVTETSGSCRYLKKGEKSLSEIMKELAEK